MALGRHGDHGNLWDGFVFKKDEDVWSDPFDTKFGNEIQIFGEMGGSGMVQLQFSQDGEHWYNGPCTDVDEDGHFDIRESGIQARYIRLHAWEAENFYPKNGSGESEESDDDRMITATLVATTVR